MYTQDPDIDYIWLVDHTCGTLCFIHKDIVWHCIKVFILGGLELQSGILQKFAAFVGLCVKVAFLRMCCKSGKMHQCLTNSKVFEFCSGASVIDFTNITLYILNW